MSPRTWPCLPTWSLRCSRLPPPRSQYLRCHQLIQYSHGLNAIPPPDPGSLVFSSPLSVARSYCHTSPLRFSRQFFFRCRRSTTPGEYHFAQRILIVFFFVIEHGQTRSEANSCLSGCKDLDGDNKSVQYACCYLCYGVNISVTSFHTPINLCLWRERETRILEWLSLAVDLEE